MTEERRESAVNPLPGALVLLLLAMVLPELAFQVGRVGLLGGGDGAGWRALAVELFAFHPETIDRAVEDGGWPGWQLLSLLSCPFVNRHFMFTALALTFVASIGKIVADRLPGPAFLTVFMGASVVGALFYWLVAGEARPLHGSFPGAYGLFGSLAYLIWLKAALRDSQSYLAFVLIGGAMAIRLVAGLLPHAGNEWIADLAAIPAGFAITLVLVPGGATFLWLFFLRGVLRLIHSLLR